MKIEFTKISILIFFSILLFSCNNNNSLKEEKKQQQTTSEVDEYVEKIVDRYGIPGATVAVIRNDSIIHHKNYGLANIEHNVAVTDSSLFRVYSITKIFIAVGIFQLVEQNKISLDDKISKYLSDLPEEWKNIEIKHLITHSSGLPDYKSLENYNDLTTEEMEKQLYSKNIQFKLGEQYEYNQTNYWFLHKIIQKITGLTLTEFIISNQFSDKTQNVLFSSDSRDIVSNRVTSYFPFTKGDLTIEHFYGGEYNFATNGMNLTLNEFINWSKKLNHNILLNKKTTNLMWEEYPYNNKTDLFTHGWDKFKSNNEISYGFTGNLTNVYRTFPKQNLSIIFLANGLTTFFDVDNVANHLAYLTDNNLKNSETYLYETLIQASDDEFESFLSTYKNLKKQNSEKNFESFLNSIGYFHLGKENYTMAIQIFELNSNEYPKSWNAFDSLGEAYENSGDDKKAIKYYRKAIELNYTNENDNNERLANKILELKN
ncbi:serine hydrolase [Aquimarina algiphila]|uniref:serine hydrolase n=1 Tax=Aquimarina algiphila TaxID=2047982 RepID=UPI002330C021|nr:serine hydrolase [Aquimarina algiphila]